MTRKKENPFFPEDKRDEFRKTLRAGKSITVEFKGVNPWKLQKNIGGIVMDELGVVPVFTKQKITVAKNSENSGTISLRVYRPMGGGRIYLHDPDSDSP